MSTTLELWTLLFYFVQQLGVMLAVGGEVIVLVAYLRAIRDTNISETEASFARAVRHVVFVGLVCIIISGIAITYIHIAINQATTIFEPAYIFKWTLIGVLLLVALLHRRVTISTNIAEGLIGGTWLALFFLHVLAPVTSWSMLGRVYVLWIVCFMFFWAVAVLTIGGKDMFSRGHQEHTEAEPPPTPAPPPAKAQAPPPAVVRMPAPKPQPPVRAPEPKPLPPPLPLPLPKEEVTHTVVSMPTEAFPYKKPVIDPTAILHPHLTAESSFGLAPESSGGGEGSIHTADVTEHLPAVRVMPRSPEDLETQQRGPTVRYG